MRERETGRETKEKITDERAHGIWSFETERCICASGRRGKEQRTEQKRKASW